MRRLLLITAAALALLAPMASAQVRAGSAVLGARAALGVPPASCPAGVPTQAITVVNQAHVSPFALATVERAIVDQSVQLRAAWGTPCVRFAASGWPLYLQIGSVDGAHGNHYGGPGAATYGFVWTSGSPWPGWGYMVSHEIVEMLVNPTTGRGIWHDDEGIQLEVVDPVEDQTYRLDGVNVSDFVLPSWFAGATQTAACDGSGCSYSDPLPGSDAGWPYDLMHVLASPWQDHRGT